MRQKCNLFLHSIELIANSHPFLYNITVKRKSGILLFVLLVTLISQSLSSPASAQESDSIYVQETGHWIWGKFLEMYISVEDPLFYFGLPITDDFIDPVTQAHVQYFEKARFDLLDTPEGPRVQLAPLGQWLYQGGNPLANIPSEGPSCRLFPSGYSVCYAFLQFYDSKDGATHFGQPISLVEVIEDRYMQYFDYVRLEWWPDQPEGERVKISNLGTEYFNQYVADPTLLKPEPSPEESGNLINPQVKVFALSSRIGAKEAQTVYTVVHDPFMRPVAGAQVEVTVIYPNGVSEIYQLPESNEFGVSQFTFSAPDLVVQSVVRLNATIHLRGETASGKSWFRIWW